MSKSTARTAKVAPPMSKSDAILHATLVKFYQAKDKVTTYAEANPSHVGFALGATAMALVNEVL